MLYTEWLLSERQVRQIITFLNGIKWLHYCKVDQRCRDKVKLIVKSKVVALCPAVHLIRCLGEINQRTTFTFETQSVTYHSGKRRLCMSMSDTRASESMSNLRAACQLTRRSSGRVRSSHQRGREEGCLVHLSWANPSLYWSLRWARRIGCRRCVHADELRSSLAWFDWIVKRKWRVTWIAFLQGW